MKPALFVAGALLGLAACSERSDFIPLGLPGQAQSQIAAQSRLSDLKPGMTLQAVSQIAGSPVGNFDDPNTVGRVCFSHPYGSATAPMFIHAVYLGGHLQRASDGHAAMCGPGDI